MAKQLAPCFTGKAVGDTVYLPPSRRSDGGDVQIFKIGRDYVYVGTSQYQQVKLRIETGEETEHPYRMAHADRETYSGYAKRRNRLGRMIVQFKGYDNTLERAAQLATEDELDELAALFSKWGITVDET